VIRVYDEAGTVVETHQHAGVLSLGSGWYLRVHYSLTRHLPTNRKLDFIRCT